MSMLGLQLLHSYNLREIAQQAYQLHRQDKERKRLAAQKITVSYLMTNHGFTLAELFGHHLANELRESLLHIGKKKGIIRMNYEQFTTLMNQVWVNMSQYKVFLPVLFSILKGHNNTIALKHLSEYVEICRSQINPFMARIKEFIPPTKIKELIANMEVACERQDLKNQGFVDKIIIVDLIKKYLGSTKETIQLDEKLVSNDQVNYKLLLGPSYLRSGLKIRQFLQGKLANKIKRFFKKCGQKKKSSKKKKQTKKLPTKQKVKKQTKEEKIIREYMQQNKKQIKQDRKKLQIIIKSILYQCIYSAANVASTELDQQPDKAIKKSIYTAEHIVERQLQCLPNQPVKLYPILHDSALFVSEGEGRIINLLDGSIKSTFSLNPSRVLKASPICDYAYFNNMLYVIRQDGLLVSWNSEVYSFNKMIQSEFRYSCKPIEEFNSKNVLFIAQGIIIVNCCEINNSLQLYSLDLQFIGNIFLNKQEFGISHAILKQCKEMGDILKSLKRDYTIKNQLQYQSLIRSSYEEKQYELGNYLFGCYEAISALKVGDHVDWVNSYKFSNSLYLDKAMMQRLRIKKTSKQDYNYLMTYQYIKEATQPAIDQFLKSHSFVEVQTQRRKEFLITLFQDNSIKQLQQTYYLTRQQFLTWIQKCSLSPKQQNTVFDNLTYNPQGKVCMYQFVHSQQYRKIVSLRQNRFYSMAHYQHNQLPPIIIKEIMPFPLLQFFIVTTRFPTHHFLYVISFHNIVITQINLNQYIQDTIGRSPPTLTFCQQSGYLAVSYHNVLTLWNINKMNQASPTPIKIVKGLERDPIIGLQLLYYSNTLATLTQQQIKIWDLHQVLFNNQTADIVFSIKPGFKAIEKLNEVSRWQPKKKIMIRGRSLNFVAATTKSSNSLIGVVSKGERPTDAFVKLSYVCKFHILIGSSRNYDQIPTKILRQLQSQARRMKYTQRVLSVEKYNQEQQKMVNTMIEGYSKLLGQVKQSSSKELFIALINKVSDLHSMLTHYSKIVNTQLLSLLQIEEIKTFKFNLILKIYLSQSDQQLRSIFTSQFIQFYEQGKQLNKDVILQDIFEWQDRSYLNKFLCILCQVYKYSLPYKCGYVDLIFNQKSELDANLIEMLLVNSQISKNIIRYVLSLANQIKFDNVKSVTVKVIDKFLPTHYRYPSLRYYKNIYKHSGQAPFDYFTNRFDHYTHVKPNQVVVSPKGYKDIFEHIEKQKLLDKLQALSKVYPQIIIDNLQLIDICMSYSLITEQEATFYILATTNNSLLNLLADVAPKKSIVDFDNVIGGIVFALSERRTKIPIPHFTYMWFYEKFKEVIGNDDKLYDIFYNELRGSLTQHIAYSRELQFYIDLNKKNIKINYNPISWKHLIGTRIYPLTHHIDQLRQSFAKQTLVSCLTFQKHISQIIPKQAQTITIRACAASKNHDSFINSFNEERLLKEYEEDYINADHFFFYLQQSKRQKQAQSLSISHMSSSATSFQLKVPSYCLINQLAKFTAFLTRQQLMQIASQSVSSFTYGSMLKWLNSMPFTRMRGKGKKELRVCAIWQLKNYLKVQWQTFGWMLLNKYGKVNVLNKCMIIEGTIDVKQLNQVFLSEALFKLFVVSNPQLKQYEQTYPLEVLQRIVDKQLVNPALQAIYLVFKHQIHRYLAPISEVLAALANKTEEIQLQKFARYFLTDSDTKESILKLILNNLIGRTKKIKIKESLAKLAAFTKNMVSQTAVHTLQKWIKGHSEQERSFLEIIIPIIEPHNIVKKKQLNSQSLIITRQHLNELFQKQQPWVYSYQPYFTLPQFIEFISLSQGQNENLSNLINNCIIKHGVHSIFKSVEMGSFPQFYAKCRSVSKNLAKLTVIQFSKLYETLSQEGKGLSLLKLFKASQLQIVADERINWIIEYMQKTDKEHSSTENLRISNLLLNLKEPVREVQGLVATLKYQEYLIKRYIKSANKLAIILKQLEDPLAIYQIFNEIHLTHEQGSILTKYLKIHGHEMLSKLRQSQSVVTIQPSQAEEKVLLQEIADYLKYFELQNSLDNNNSEFNPNMAINQKWVISTSLFKKMSEENSPQWSCLPSYINLYQYCRYLLVSNIFKKYKYRQMVLDLLNKTLTAISFSHKNLYQIFSLAYMDNFIKYLPYFLFPNPHHHAMDAKLFKVFNKYLCQAFVTFDGVNEVKYPLNLAGFNQLMGLTEAKSQLKSVDYGQIYKGLNIWGCGYVNLNDIYDYRLKRVAYPYIEINSYIAETYPTVRQWRKINPPAQVFQNRQKISVELIRLQSNSPFKSKVIAQANLWRIMGYYLTKQHRLYIEHQFRVKNNPEYYNIVEVIEWINTNEEENEAESADILAKVVSKIEEEGGIYNALRKYHKHIILSQQVDYHKQKTAYLSHLLQQSGTLHISSLKQFVKDLLQSHKIEHYLDTEHTIQNQGWLQQALKLIMDTYNKEVREWSNYNNNLVKFLNELPQDQFCLIKQLYQSNYEYTSHKLFDILATGSHYFTFTSFWVYNTSSDDAYPYSKEEVHQVYKIIDVNSDGNISYQQFCRFWSAVQQIFVRPAPPTYNKVTTLKANILDTFLDSIQNIIEKQVDSERGYVSIGQLQVLTNIKNKQKLQRLIKIVSPQDQFARQIDTHKLKILLKQHKIKKNNHLHIHIKHSNYFAIALGQEIQIYVNNKDNLQNTLSRWLAFTYPNFGYYLAQVFYELGWNKQKIIEWIGQYHPAPSAKPIQTMKNSKIIANISADNEHLYRRVVQMPKQFELFYKKFLRKHIQPKQYGKSISYKLHLNKIIEDYEVIIKEIDHVSYFLNQVDSDQNRLIYKFQPNQNQVLQSNPLLHTLPSFQKALKNGQLTFSNYPLRLDIKNNLLLLETSNEYLCKRQYEVINKQLRGRSNNRFSLISNKALYSDPKISISFYNQSTSNLSKLILYTDYTNFKPLPSVQIVKYGKFTGLQSMIRLVDLAVYIQKEYQVIGLFVNLNNVCIDYSQQKQFKLSQFIGGIKLDAQGNYFEGVNPKEINNDTACIYPPQVYQNIFTETFDSYCLAHILYYLYTGEIVQNKALTPSAEESHWFNYSQLHYKAKQEISFLSLQDKNLDVQSEIVFFTLIYECTSFEWHLRPKVYQIAQTLRNIALLNCRLQNIGQSLIIKAPISQICLRAAQTKDIKQFEESVKASKDYQWTIAQIEKIRVSLPDDPKYYSLFNELLQQTLVDFQQNGEVETIGEFMRSVVEYLCQSQRKQTAFLALQAYKNIITSAPVKRYFDYCDDQWKINEFNIHQKLKQLNTQNRIVKLPKSSQYYLDICTLIDTKITLYMADPIVDSKVKKHDSTKKIAISFIESSLLSHNVNKICALQKSKVLLNLYKYLDDPEFESTVLRIYYLATCCFNEEEHEVSHRAMEQGYKVMMVMHNIISLDKGVKTGQTVVDMLTYMNNYYNFYGEECKNYVLQRLCHTQICNLPTLTFLFNLKIQNIDLLYKILLNLTYSQAYYKMLKGVTIQAYDVCMKDIKKNTKYHELRVRLERLLKNHQIKITLNELSTQSIQMQTKQFYISKESTELFTNYSALIQKHVLFYAKKANSLTKGQHFRYQNNFYEHYSTFLAQMRKMAKNELQNSYFNGESCGLIKSVLDLHLTVLQMWYMEQQTIKYLMEFTQQLYQTEFLYVENILLNSIEKTVFDILILLVKKSYPVMVKLGFIHFFMRIMKKQHELIGVYVRKGVQNIQLKKIYSQQAEFRLNAIDLLLQGNSQQIHRIFVVVGFPKYLIQVMLSSSLLLDLRYYKANFDIVPFRFCNPLRSQAITVLSFILPIKDSVLRAEVVSRLIPVISMEKEKLLGPVDTAQNKMKFVEALWLFGNIIECEEERLKYEFVNNGGYEVINNLVSRYELLSVFFPKMSETIKTGTILKSSMVFSRMLTK